MKPPFSTEQFFHVFEDYNSGVFPAQIILLLLSIAVLFILHSRIASKHQIIGGFLAFLWIWMGLVYHLIFFWEINKAAFLFGGIFILQGLLIFFYTFIIPKLEFKFTSQLRDYIGYFFIFFGMVIYPAISYASEGSLSRIISVGLPCPSTIMTLGFFMLATKQFPPSLLIIPVLWAIAGLSAAIYFDLYQDLMMLIAGISASILLMGRRLDHD